MTDPASLPPRRAFLGLLPLFALGACGQQGDLPPTMDQVAPPSVYQIGPGTPPDAQVALMLVRGQAAAPGELIGNGYRTRFTVTGLSPAPGSPGRLEVIGDVFGLPRRDIFAGTYRNVTSAQGDLSNMLQLGNDNLVVIRLRPARTPTAMLVAADSGVVVTVAP